MTVRVFLSHISNEAAEARALKAALEAQLPGLDVFVSAADIHLGSEWLSEISAALSEARVLLALCSPNSIRRPWLNFETGSGWTRGLPVIPLCYAGLRKDRLRDPLRIFQGVELTDVNSCRQLLVTLSQKLGLTLPQEVDAASVLAALKAVPIARTDDIGVVLSHRQGEWDDGDQPLLGLGTRLPAGLHGNWTIHPIDDERPFLSSALHRLSGLIFASPWRARIEPETIAAVAEWVRRGGRLCLLGFELGDRHHDANLADLSQRFGIHPNADIVGPPAYGASKPYQVPVDYDVACGDAHWLTDGLTTVRLTNAQTISVEPGGSEWLRVGHNVVNRPRRESVRYRDGTMTAPGGSAFEAVGDGRAAVAVEAPSGLCGQGRVIMIGTWDLVGRGAPSAGENTQLVTRLLDWLSRRDS